MTANWTAPASTGGSAITGYTVTAYNPDGTQNQTFNAGSTLRSLTFTFTVAGPFTIDVQAFNIVGTGALSARSAPTNAV